MLGGFAKRFFKEHESRCNGPRVIEGSFSWHYDVSQDEEYESALTSLVSGEFKTSRNHTNLRQGNNGNAQPTWDIFNPPDAHHFNEEIRQRDFLPEEGQGCSGGFDIWAYYKPFHNTHRPAGIHLFADGVAGCAAALLAHKNSCLGNRGAVVWAMNLLYLHELVHQIVEDVVTALEFRIGKEIYLPTQRRYGGYILMEEALANSFARSLQDKFFSDWASEAEREKQAIYDHKKYIKDIEPQCNVSNILGNLDNLMRSQPPGYRDYADFGQNFERLFLQNLESLLAYVYLPSLEGIHGGELRHRLHHYEHDIWYVINTARNDDHRSFLYQWSHEDIVCWCK